MGTTADKLQAVLDSKEAIRSKFGLAEDLPFSQYAANINTSGSTSGSTDFYLCKSFEYTGSYPAYFNFSGQSISGTSAESSEDGTNGAIGTLPELKIASPYVTGTDRMWFSDSLEWRVSYNYTRELWEVKYKGAEDDASDGVYFTKSDIDDHETKWQGQAVNGTQWSDAELKITEMPAFAGVFTWVGAPVALGDDGTYAADETNTINLAYPEKHIVQIGHIYNADATIEAAWLYKDLDPLAKYLCTYVNRNYFSYNTIVVSGMPTDAFAGTDTTYTDMNTGNTATLDETIAARDPNGTYTLTNPDAQYTSYLVWQSENGCIIRSHWDGGGWLILPGDYTYLSKYIVYQPWDNSTHPAPDDYTSYTYQYYNGSAWTDMTDASVAVPEPEPVEQYWEGYKLVQNENGKWTIDYSENVKLTYGDYMPVTGRFYDADCSMEITNADLSEDALWSCPRNMTSNENDEWVITTDSCYSNSANDSGYCAFDGSLSTQWITYNPSGDDKDGWICWQNKKRKVCVKYIEMYKHESSGDYFINPQLEGSDDGVNWQVIERWEAWDMGNYGMTQKDFSENTQFFYYHRIIDMYGGGARAGAGLIKAFSQLSRDVPK